MPLATLLLARKVIPMIGPPIERGAVLIREGRVAELGAAGDLIRRHGRTAEKIDLQEQILLPSFVDAHLHLLELVRLQAGVDLSGATRESEVLPRLGTGGSGVGWRLAFGLDRHRFEGWSQDPRRVLDRVCPDRALVVASLDLHTLWANSKALAAAGLPPGSGELSEGGSLPLRRAVPLPDGEDWDQALGRVARALLEKGITRVQDFSGLRVHEGLRSSQERKPLPLKFSTSIHLQELTDAQASGYRSGVRSGRLCFGHLKLFGDGSLGSRTAWMLDPLVGGQERGRQSFEIAELGAIVDRAHREGLRVALHAIGTAAVRQAAAVLGPLDRIEHAQHIRPEDHARIAGAGCACCVNPLHLPLDWRAAERLLPGGGAGSYPFGSLLRAGVPVGFGSDAPVAPADPLAALAWAVRRCSPEGQPAGGWFPEERIGVEAALRASTLRAAELALAPDEGRIAPGACADLIALDRDPLQVPTQELAAIRVTRLWMDGREAWRA